MGKIRNRDPLKPNHKDKRITRSKPNRNYYLTSKAVEITQKKIDNKAIRAQKGVESQRKPIVIKRKEDITPTSEDRKDIKFLTHRSHPSVWRPGWGLLDWWGYLYCRRDYEISRNPPWFTKLCRKGLAWCASRWFKVRSYLWLRKERKASINSRLWSFCLCGI